MVEGLTPEEMPAEEEDKGIEEVSNSDFLNAVKRVIYGTESLLETVDIDWSDEIAAIVEDIKEAKELWPTKEGC